MGRDVPRIPLGWGARSADSILLARLAKESGLFPVFEAEAGEVVGVERIHRQVPVEEYLHRQRRYAHLFGPPQPETIARIQARMMRNGIPAYRLRVRVSVR
ncbi:MAG TPA: hypothetical protein VLR26_16300, partial [Frankiaceae bacterium]|nr:hypothetical protein [Frankiaceae bacterium]